MTPELLRVCKLLNERGIAYLVIGAYACALHGYTRATNDIDLLVEKSEVNLEKIIAFIKSLYPHLDINLTPEEIINDVVIKILDEPELDISIRAWEVEFEQAIKASESAEIDGVKIPFLGIDDLIRSKSTLREIDQWDIKILLNLKKKRNDS